MTRQGERATDRSDGAGSHQQAADAFVRRLRERSVPGIEAVLLFGSAAKGDATGLPGDVDFLVGFRTTWTGARSGNRSGTSPTT